MKSNINLFFKMVTHSSDVSELTLKNEIFFLLSGEEKG
jgi:hypothetical protein